MNNGVANRWISLETKTIKNCCFRFNAIPHYLWGLLRRKLGFVPGDMYPDGKAFGLGIKHKWFVNRILTTEQKEIHHLLIYSNTVSCFYYISFLSKNNVTNYLCDSILIRASLVPCQANLFQWNFAFLANCQRNCWWSEIWCGFSGIIAFIPVWLPLS